LYTADSNYNGTDSLTYCAKGARACVVAKHDRAGWQANCNWRGWGDESGEGCTVHEGLLSACLRTCAFFLALTAVAPCLAAGRE